MAWVIIRWAIVWVMERLMEARGVFWCMYVDVKVVVYSSGRLPRYWTWLYLGITVSLIVSLTRTKTVGARNG